MQIQMVCSNAILNHPSLNLSKKLSSQVASNQPPVPIKILSMPLPVSFLSLALMFGNMPIMSITEMFVQIMSMPFGMLLIGRRSRNDLWQRQQSRNYNISESRVGVKQLSVWELAKNR